MESILVRAQALKVGGHSALGKDVWKFAMGDAIAQMQALVKHAQESVLRPAVHTTVEAKEAARKCRDQYKAFMPDVKQHKHQRDVLVDYAAVARLFPPANPVRTELSHSHARALARVKVPEARAALTGEAIRFGWSVARLQAEINTAGQQSVDNKSGGENTGSAEKLGTQNEAPRDWAKTQNSTWFCAQTGNPITNRKAMVELHIQPESTLDAALACGSKRGGAAKKKPNGEQPDPPRVLRFESASALLTWLGARLAPAILEAAVPAADIRLSAEPANRIIVSPILKKSRTAKAATGGVKNTKALTGGVMISEAPTGMTTGEKPPEEL